MMPYERFKAWEKCHELVLAIYTASKKWPREELYGLTAQARRAAFSAAANIVEGGARPGSREFSRFLGIAVASLYELAYILRLARDLGLLTAEDSRQLETAREHASKLTWRLYEAVGRPGLVHKKAACTKPNARTTESLNARTTERLNA